jgi:hypothetical protein
MPLITTSGGGSVRGFGRGNDPVLYPFTSFTFTSAGATGQFGPTISQCESTYSGQAFLNGFFSMPSFQGYQLWTVPESSVYRISARGASTETSGGGRPAIVTGEVSLTVGAKLWICVGQTRDSIDYGQGGGSFVALSNNGNIAGSIPLIIAGGSGCSAFYSSEPNFQQGGRIFADAQLTQNISPSVLGAGFSLPPVPTTGEGGTVNSTSNPGFGQGGAGWNGNGQSTPGATGSAVDVLSFFNGLAGGAGQGEGAFGGAGSRLGGFGTGGGGGYTGGCFSGDSSLALRRSTGGSCYVSGANQSLSLGSAGDTGYVFIEKL